MSPELEPIKTEYKLCLIDIKWSAYYGKEAAEDYFSGDFEGVADNLVKSTEYVASATVHLEKIGVLIETLPTPGPHLPHSTTPSPTPTPRSFEAIFAISSLLVVAYLVRRRRIE